MKNGWLLVVIIVALGGGLIYLKSRSQVAPPSTSNQISTQRLPIEEPTGQVTLTIPRGVEVTTGENVTVEIMVESPDPLQAIDLALSFNPDMLKLVSITPGSFFVNPQEFSQSIDEQAGSIFYALGSLEPSSGSGPLVSITFTGLADGSTDIVMDEETLASVRGFEKTVITVE